MLRALLQIGNDIVDMLYADRQTDIGIQYTVCYLIFRRQL